VDTPSRPVRVVTLDVTAPGKHHGEISDKALSWLDSTLRAEPSRPTVLMMHKPPMMCGVPYLDKYRCMNGDKLERLLMGYPAVERVLCGHVHRQMLRRFGDTLLRIGQCIVSRIPYKYEETDMTQESEQ
jgi:Icc protein